MRPEVPWPTHRRASPDWKDVRLPECDGCSARDRRGGFSAPSQDLHNVVWWLLGNLQVFDARLLEIVTIVVALGLAVCVLLARDLNVMTLGDEAARAVFYDNAAQFYRVVR